MTQPPSSNQTWSSNDAQRRGGGSDEPAPVRFPRPATALGGEKRELRPQEERDTEPGAGCLLLDSRDVARLLGIGRSKVYMMLALGQLPTVRLGRCVRVPRPALERWLEAETVMPAMGSGSNPTLPGRLRPRRP